MFDYETLRIIWWAFMGVLLIGFALTGGFDLGIGTLLPFLGKNDEERRVIINAIGHTWEGNQVWFITAGGALFAAWPLVYAAAFSGLYIALLLVLFTLIFRAVGFDYRSKVVHPLWRSAWDWALFAGGAVPALVFGIIFGNLLEGLPFHLDGSLRVYYTGSFFELFNPFAALAGGVSLSMLIMHGAAYLALRTEGVIQARAHQALRWSALVMMAGFALAGVWLAFGIEGYKVVYLPAWDSASNPLAKAVEKVPGAWLANYGLHPWMVVAPVFGFAGAWAAMRFSVRQRPGLAFAGSALAVTGVILTAGFSLFPFIMPSATDPKSSLTVWDASASHLTLQILFWATVIFLPIVIAYTGWAYRVMWGKLTVESIHQDQHTLY